MDFSYIDDGMNLEGYIEPFKAGPNGDRRHAGLEFTYRVATRSEWIRLDSLVARAKRDGMSTSDGKPSSPEVEAESEVKAEQITCEWVAKHVESWNVKNRKGDPIAVSADACMRLDTILFQKLGYIIRADMTSDQRPEQTTEPTSEEDRQKN